MDRGIFFLLLALVAGLSLRAALNPSPPLTQAERILDELEREISRVASLINCTRPEEAWEALNVIREDHLSVLRARAAKLRGTLAELSPAVVFRLEGSDLVVSVWGIRAGGLAASLRWDPRTWRLVELLPAEGVKLTLEGHGKGELRFVLLSDGTEGELLRVRGEGKPELWLSPAGIELFDKGNKLVTEFSVVLR